MNPVFAFGIASDFLMSGLLQRVVLPTAIDHAVHVAVLEICVVSAGVTLPGFVRNKDNFLRLGT